MQVIAGCLANAFIDEHRCLELGIERLQSLGQVNRVAEHRIAQAVRRPNVAHRGFPRSKSESGRQRRAIPQPARCGSLFKPFANLDHGFDSGAGKSAQRFRRAPIGHDGIAYEFVHGCPVAIQTTNNPVEVRGHVRREVRSGHGLRDCHKSGDIRKERRSSRPSIWVIRAR